jgi:Mg-chelatase subunit ChlI
VLVVLPAAAETVPETVVAAWEMTGAAAEATLPAAEETVPAVDVTAVAVEDAGVAVEDAGVAVEDAGVAVEGTAAAAAFAAAETAETSEPLRTAGGWVAAEAGAASSTPMPNARHRPLIAAPKAHNSTFRTGTYQPFMPGTLVT